MDSLLFDLGVSFILSAIKSAFKSEEKKEAVKKGLLKIRNQINLLYPEENGNL